MKKALFLIFLLVVVLSVSGFAYYNQVYLPAQATPEPAYNTSKVRSGDITISAAGAGNVLPSEKVAIGFLIGGTLAELNVNVGDKVEAGQVLAHLDATDAQLKLRQAELALNSFYAPDTLHQAEIAVLNAKAKLDDAADGLEYLISPSVYYWETALVKAQAELDTLESSNKASESELEVAKKAVEKAALYLKSAKNEYYASYVWDVFPYSYEDEDTGETIDTYLEPAPDAIALARLTVVSAELALKDAEEYFQALQAGPDTELGVSYTGSDLAKLDQARLDLASAQIDLEKTQLIAPISGTVTGLNANAGQVIGTTPFLTIETLDQMALRFYVEESDLHFVQAGNRVVINFEAYPDQPVEGEVTYLEPALQTVDGSPAAAVWASLAEPLEFQLLSGMSAEVEVIAGEAKNVLLVPVQALREIAPGSYAVFIEQADGSLKMTPVTVGLKDYVNAQILSGLKAGDLISTGAAETK